MPPERLEHRFRFYRAKPHQQQGIRLLHQAIRDGLPPEQVLVEEAPLALHSTLGCLRLHNIDLRDRVLLLAERGTVDVGVFPER